MIHIILTYHNTSVFKFILFICRRAIHSLVVLLVVLIAVMTMTGGCSYKNFSLTDGIARFSFKYPSSYYLENVRLEDNPWEYTRISLWTTNKDSEESGIDSAFLHDAGILVLVENVGHSYSSVEDAVEKSITWWTSRGYEDFQLLERSDVEIAGLRGEKIVYSFDSYHLYETSSGIHSVKNPSITRRIFFEHDGMIWLVALTAYESYAETAKADFAHIVDTFKILN